MRFNMVLVPMRDCEGSVRNFGVGRLRLMSGVPSGAATEAVIRDQKATSIGVSHLGG